MRRRGAGWWLIGLAALLALAAARAWNPESAGFQICVYRNLLDLPCPGCGLTRAMAHLARGSFARSVELHPLAPFLALEAATVWLAWGVLGGDRLRREISLRAELVALVNAVPLLGLWLGRAATGSLPF